MNINFLLFKLCVIHFFVWSVAIDFHAVPAVQHNCMHINHTCLSAMISDLNRLFARAVSGVYRHCLNQNCLNVAKCNLGKVNLEAMLVSSFPSYSWGGPMPLAGNKKQTKCATPQMYIYQKNKLLFNLLG